MVHTCSMIFFRTLHPVVFHILTYHIMRKFFFETIFMISGGILHIIDILICLVYLEQE